MNITYLKYALEVKRTGSINKAAENLIIAQPNLSRAIKDLEATLGVTIFNRNSKGITVTPDGEKVLNYAEKILNEVNVMETMFKENKDKTTFSLSVPRTSYISNAFAEFSKEISIERNLEIFYEETNSNRAIENILKNDYKLGIIRYPISYAKQFKNLLTEKKFTFELIAEFKLCVIFSKNSVLSQFDKIKQENLNDFIEITHPDTYIPYTSRDEIRENFISSEIKRRIFVYERASQFELLSKNTHTFMFVSPIPKETLEKYNLMQVEVLNNDTLYQDVLIYKNDYKLTDYDKDFITRLCASKRKTFND